MFLPNVPGATFIQGGTFIPESRVKGIICVLEVTAKRVKDRSIISSNLITDSLLICVFCKSKQNFMFPFVQNKDELDDKFWLT